MDQENQNSLGEYLRESREKNNYSIEKLSLKTRISPSVIKSLESEEFSSLPSPAYLKGFVTTYVKVFSLDEDVAFKKLVETYERKTGQTFPALNHAKKYESTVRKDKSEHPDEVINNSENIFDTIKPMVPYIIGVAVVASAFGVYKFASQQINNEVKSYQDSEVESVDSVDATAPITEATTSEPAQELNSPATTQTTAPAEAPVVPEVKKEVKPEVKPAQRSEDIKTEKPEKRMSSAEKRLFPHIDFKPLVGPLYTPKPNAPENKDDSLMPRSYKAKMDANLQNIYVNATDGETWVSYKVDEEPIQNEFIREGKALFLQGEVIRMFFGNINVTKIFLNNTFIDGYTKTGVKSIVFPQEKAESLLRPLFPKSASGEYFTAEEYKQRMEEEESRSKTGNP